MQQYLVDDKGEPVGTRIFGPVTRELKKHRGQMKIISLSTGGFVMIIKKGLKVKVLTR